MVHQHPGDDHEMLDLVPCLQGDRSDEVHEISPLGTMDGLAARIGPRRIHREVMRARLKTRCSHSSVPWSWKT